MSYEVAAKEAFENDATLAVVLMALLRRAFGDDVYFWDPTTVYLEIRDEFGAEPATMAMDRISAAQVVISGDAFFQDIGAFFNICNTFASGQPAFSVFDPVEPEEAAWAITEVALMRDLLPFAPTIRSYLRLQLRADGYTEEDYPAVFDYVLTRKVPRSRELKDVLSRTLHDDQRDNVENFLLEQMDSVVHQFDKIPGMPDTLQELLREKDLEDLAELRA